MPKILEDLRRKLSKRGLPKSNAYAVATAALQKQGKLPKAKKK
jgi:hypothetical protein